MHARTQQACINVIHVSNIITAMLFCCSFLDVSNIIDMSVKMLKALLHMPSGLFISLEWEVIFLFFFCYTASLTSLISMPSLLIAIQLFIYLYFLLFIVFYSVLFGMFFIFLICTNLDFFAATFERFSFIIMRKYSAEKGKFVQSQWFKLGS